MNIREIIDMVKGNDMCEVFQPIGIPNLKTGDKLPSDIEEFYSLCGGIHFFKDSEYEFIVVSP